MAASTDSVSEAKQEVRIDPQTIFSCVYMSICIYIHMFAVRYVVLASDWQRILKEAETTTLAQLLLLQKPRFVSEAPCGTEQHKKDS